jgi:hypothetical protein
MRCRAHTSAVVYVGESRTGFVLRGIGFSFLDMVSPSRLMWTSSGKGQVDTQASHTVNVPFSVVGYAGGTLNEKGRPAAASFGPVVGFGATRRP